MNSPDYEVAIIGCGPVGVTLAGLLAGRGLRTVAIDRLTDLYPLPRAAHIDDETLRTLQELGAADEIRAAVVDNDGMDFLNAEREPLLSMVTPPRTVSGWPASMMFHQPTIEHAMRHAAAARGAELRLGCEVTTIDADDPEVVHLHLLGGESISARYVVGCDGARSLTRHHVGVTMRDADFEQRWLVIDLLLAPGAERPTARALQVCDPTRPHTLIPMPGERFRFEFMLLPGETDANVDDPQVIRTLLSTWIDPATAHVERHAIYTFHGLVASPWRRGRVLLAGDAAHQMPPFLGQGMCSGIRDAANLAWKLERVLRHGAPEELLDTYEAERAPHVQAIVDAAVFFGRIICTTDQAEAASRDEGMLAARAAGEAPPAADPVPPVSPGPLIHDGGGGAALQVHRDGLLSDDLLGTSFAVLTRSSTADGAVAAWVGLGARHLCAADHPAVEAILDAVEAEAMVVRPDRKVMWAGVTLAPPAASVAHLVGTPTHRS